MADQHETSPDQQWVVAYYDLLGIQREMDKWENPQATCGKIDLFRHALTRTLEKSVNRQLDLRNSRSPSFVHGRECEFLYFGFADTVVIASPVVNRFGWPQTMALSMLLMITVPLTAILLEDGILFRAGVEVGTARRVRSVSDYIGVSSSDSAANNRFFSGDIAGPAYVEAHSLASVKGSPPGTFLGKGAIALLQEARSGCGRSQRTRVASATQRLRMLMRLDGTDKYQLSDKGNVWAVDFANLKSTGAREADAGYQQTQDLLRKGYQWVCGALQPGSDDGVREKLQWLKNYLESRGFGGPGP